MITLRLAVKNSARLDVAHTHVTADLYWDFIFNGEPERADRLLRDFKRRHRRFLDAVHTAEYRDGVMAITLEEGDLYDLVECLQKTILMNPSRLLWRSSPNK